MFCRRRRHPPVRTRFTYINCIYFIFYFVTTIERKSTSEPPFSVIAVKSYQAGANDELTFSKEQKITVLRQETEKWFIGEINGKRGMFPSECVARVALY